MQHNRWPSTAKFKKAPVYRRFVTTQNHASENTTSILTRSAILLPQPGYLPSSMADAESQASDVVSSICQEFTPPNHLPLSSRKSRKQIECDDETSLIRKLPSTV